MFFCSSSSSVTYPPPPRLARVDPEGGKLTKFAVFQWTPVCQNMTMLDPETVLYGVKQHSGAARRRRLAPSRPGFAFEAFSGQPWAGS